MYMNEWVIRAAIVGVIGVCGIGAGIVYADQSNEDARRKQKEEIEYLRKHLKSVLATFGLIKETD
jgi:cadmium resistance protein CadD (predicted permease)